jgi:hypothetical protein
LVQGKNKDIFESILRVVLKYATNWPENFHHLAHMILARLVFGPGDEQNFLIADISEFWLN